MGARGEAVRVRAARVDDAAPMAMLHLRAFRRAYRGILPDAFLDGLVVDEWVAKRRAHLEHLPRPDLRWWLAENDDRVSGLAATGLSNDADARPNEGEVLVLYVDPDRVGTGIGRALMDHLIDDLRARGLPSLSLWVFEANDRARRFYEKAGFALDAAPAGRKLNSFGAPPTTASAAEVRYRRSLA
jgi:ribosomal protein S18 acetylase RimI-like enzyme